MSVRHFRFASESGNRHCVYALFCCWFISFPSAASNGPCQPSPNDGASIAPLDLAKEVEKLLARFPNARVNSDEQRPASSCPVSATPWN